MNSGSIPPPRGRRGDGTIPSPAGSRTQGGGSKKGPAVGGALRPALAAIVLLAFAGGIVPGAPRAEDPFGWESEGSGAGGGKEKSEAGAEVLTADEIMQRVENQKRPRFFTARVIMTTTEKKSGEVLIQRGTMGVENLGGQPGRGPNDYRSMIRIQEPQKWSGTKAFEERRLDGRRQIVCLVTVGECRPVAKGSETLFGTEVEWGDLAQANREKFDYTLDREDADRWVIKGVSKEDAGLVYWLTVEKGSFDVSKVIKEKDGRPFKQILAQKRQTVSGWDTPVPTVIEVKNLTKERESLFVLSEAMANTPIPKAFFSLN